MDFGERINCCNVLDKVRASPLAKVFEPIMSKHYEAKISNLTLEMIYDNVQSGKYQSSNKVIDDVSRAINNLIKISGKNSKIGLAGQTLLQIFYEEMDKVIASSKNNSTSRELNIIADKIKELSNEICNSPDQMPKEGEVTNSLPKKPFIQGGFDHLVVEVFDFSADGVSAESDEAIQKLAALATSYDKTIVPKKNKFSFKFSQLSPFALSLIKKYINSIDSDIITCR